MEPSLALLLPRGTRVVLYPLEQQEPIYCPYKDCISTGGFQKYVEEPNVPKELKQGQANHPKQPQG